MFAHKISVPLVPEIAFILRGVCLYVNIPIKMTAQCHSSIHATLLWMVSAQPGQRSCEQKIFFNHSLIEFYGNLVIKKILIIKESL